ncbi:MAG: hypothetical protein NTW21_31600 [Verrucomicrobia bacterium]|nr:hypothetical protein [Verrucomicrobiota bacterium]
MVLRKEGAGRVVFADNTIIPFIIVAAGTARFSDTSISEVTLDGGTVDGTGSIGRLMSLAGGGTVAPGTSVGRLTCTEVAWNVATKFVPELLTPVTPGKTHDQLKVNGPVELGGAALRVVTLAGFTNVTGNAYVIIDNDGTDAVSGTFAGLPQGAVVDIGTAAFTISYAGGTGNDVVLTQVPPLRVLSTTVVRGTGSNAGHYVIGLAGTGIPRATYQLETSPDLIRWTATQTTTASHAGTWTFTDTSRLLTEPRYFLRVGLH